MAKNDSLLIDGIVDQRREESIPSQNIGEVFELLVAEQYFKDYDLTLDEIADSNVDGRNDGGIDFIFIFINGHLLKDEKDFIYPKSNAELEIYFMTCKHANSFRLQPVDSIYASLTELLNFGLEPSDFHAQYNNEIINTREKMIYSYKKLASAITDMKISVVYASRGDSEEVADNIQARSKQVTALINSNFSGCNTNFIFWGSTELLTKFRKTKKMNLRLPYVKSISQGSDYIVLTKLKDYYEFVTDEEGALRRYLFDSNVRDYLGRNRVNSDILQTLEHEDSQDFWRLNNGVTILVTKVFSLGDTLILNDVQIVNGLQTTQSIYSYLASKEEDLDERCLLIKIIEATDNSISDEIIRATNNQTNVELSSLSATDKIQRDIEEILLANGFYYERRKKYYENQGIPKENIITPLSLAELYVALVLKLPHAAAFLRNKFMTIPEQYEAVYSQKIDLNIWPQIARIKNETERYIHSIKKQIIINNKFLKPLRSVISFFALAKIYGTYSYTISDLISFNIEDYTFDLLTSIWDIVKEKIDYGNNISCLKEYKSILELSDQFSDISEINIFKRAKNIFLYHGMKLEEEFLEGIICFISENGSYRGMNGDMAQLFNCNAYKVFQGIQYLKLKGRLQI